MSIFRSEEMGLYSITISKDSAWNVMEEMGQLDCLHFLDLNSSQQVYNRTFANLIRRCDEAERRIKYIEILCSRFGLELKEPASVPQFLTDMDNLVKIRKVTPEAYFEKIENQLQMAEKFLIDQSKKYQDMYDHYLYLTQYKYILSNLGGMMKSERRTSGDTADSGSYVGAINAGLSYITGAILKEDALRFKRILFRATRGNVFPIIKDMEKPIHDYLGRPLIKSIYLIIFKEGDTMRNKVARICDSFSNERFEVPQNIMEKEMELQNIITDTKNLMEKTRNEIQTKLSLFNNYAPDCNASELVVSKWFVRKEKNIYYTLNKMKIEGRAGLFRGLCWIPLSRIQEVEESITKIEQLPYTLAPKLKQMDAPHLTPPSFFRTNDFLAPFQAIVDTYGLPSYQEANPTLFTIITFPFLFGIMFGDVCHGSILFCISAYVCLRKDHIIQQKGMLKDLVDVRYLLILMGMFSCFCGMMYNDFASMPLHLYDSCYKNDLATGEAHRIPGCIYPWGMDPKWYSTKNELAFANSFKMKLSVIVGVLQMGLGVALKGFNSFYWKKGYDIWCEFLPQMLFLSGFFGYMVIMIYIKWAIDWTDQNQKGPSIITLLTYIGLNGGAIGEVPLYGDGSLQKFVNVFVLCITVITVPWMLLPKPILLKKEFDAKYSQQSIELQPTKTEERLNKYAPFMNEDEAEEQEKDIKEFSILDPPTPKFDFGEIMIHQIIETIEFVLGTISNTASYLRLWALSLAHAELSKVFFEYSLLIPLKADSPNPIGIFVGFVCLAGVTFGVLMCMDSLECFLHTLRLHWVEFQSKFYHATGKKFIPFSHAQVLKEIDKVENES